jgi:hypothetical protein
MYPHFHAKDLIEALESVKKKQQPVYVTKGRGSRDLINVECKEVINVEELLKKLKRLDPNDPVSLSQLKAYVEPFVAEGEKSFVIKY